MANADRLLILTLRVRVMMRVLMRVQFKPPLSRESGPVFNLYGLPQPRHLQHFVAVAM
jgi:hypothetical protein